ncbi:MAG TPA: 16S rRNA (cytosine(1402)-N(4))-methyltransferase RsmH [Candidatus Saccharimonadales bacterium]|nr:16S rRNA (cytosine(1402)-N(4))-methyltransferase RsmH [Candidatus Saccharimonadales bacterium]
MHNNDQNTLHVPVLLDEVLNVLAPKAGDSYLDLTAGYGGHASTVLENTHAYGQAVLVDRDQNAVDRLQERFAGNGVQIVRDDFLGASHTLVVAGKHFDMILADLGVSSPHLNEANRGFAIGQSGPLDMRMDQSQQLTADTVVNTYSEAELTRIIREYGEEPKASQVAHLIVRNRPIATTTELAALVAKAWPGHSRVHPATRTFQALRIAVNDELEQLKAALPIWIDLLEPGGRLAVISFHSLEDRLVKAAFTEAGGDRYDASLRVLTKRPITASPHENVFNPRARSAKLRAAVKIKRKGS